MKYKFLDLRDHSKVRHEQALSEQDKLVSNFKKPNFPIYFSQFQALLLNPVKVALVSFFKPTNLQ